MNTRFFQLLVLILSVPLWAKVSKVTPAKKQDQKCAVKMLRQKDCHLNLGVNKIQIWNDKIFLNSKISRDLEPLPLMGAQVEWENISVQQIAGRDFLELYLWADPEPKSDVQSLHWYVLEIKDGHVQKKLEKVVQKRKKLEGAPHAKGQLFKFDRKSSSELFKKNKKLYYRVDKTEGILE